MSRDIAIVGAGAILTGDLDDPVRHGADTVVARDGIITAVGRRSELTDEIDAVDTVVDAHGSSIAPGLIDSHCHVVLGDYTPRQKTVGFLESYVHGGITSVVSPGEIHAPGRPHSAVGVKALAIAARACFENFHPLGMRVHAGAVVLEPTLTERDFAELENAGVRLAKFGFGAYADPNDGVPQVRSAQEHGIIVMCHSGGASVPGSQPITPDHLLTLRPDVCGHINGGPTSLDPDGVDRIMDETGMALQVVQAGNAKSTVRIVSRAAETGALHRVVIGSDTPTGTGVMPLGMIKTVAEIASWTGLPPASVWALGSGNCATVWGLPGGRVRVGEVADLVVMDAPWGCLEPDALGALGRGDVPGISAVVIDGTLRTLLSRNTPRAARLAEVVKGLAATPFDA